jgi:hypothetical protein
MKKALAQLFAAALILSPWGSLTLNFGPVTPGGSIELPSQNVLQVSSDQGGVWDLHARIVSDQPGAKLYLKTSGGSNGSTDYTQSLSTGPWTAYSSALAESNTALSISYKMVVDPGAPAGARNWSICFELVQE